MLLRSQVPEDRLALDPEIEKTAKGTEKKTRRSKERQGKNLPVLPSHLNQKTWRIKDQLQPERHLETMLCSKGQDIFLT